MTTYKPLETGTRREHPSEWNKELVIPPTAILVETKQNKERFQIPVEQLGEEYHNGNGHLWQTVAGSQTFRVADLNSTHALETQLAETQTKLDEYAQQVDDLTHMLNRAADLHLESEALTASDETAMTLLSFLADKNSIHQEEIGKYLSVPEGWLSLAWLMKANLVEHTGSFLIITSRGRQIVDAVFGH